MGRKTTITVDSETLELVHDFRGKRESMNDAIRRAVTTAARVEA